MSDRKKRMLWEWMGMKIDPWTFQLTIVPCFDFTSCILIIGIRTDEGKFVDGTGIAIRDVLHGSLPKPSGSMQRYDRSLFMLVSFFDFALICFEISGKQIRRLLQISMFNVTSAAGSPHHTTPSCSNFIPPLIRLASNDDQLFPFRSE